MPHGFHRFAAALACACLLSSCLESYEEDMVINGDLSGRAVVRVGLPDLVASKFDAVREQFAPKNIEKRFASLSGVTLQSYTLTEGRYQVATFEVSFSSLENLGAAAAANKPAQMLVGEFAINRGEGGRRVIERKLGRGVATAELPADKFAQFKIHFQLPVEVTGTDSGLKDSSHNDVRYRWSLANIAAQQPTMVNKIVEPPPWLMIFGGGFALLIIAWFAWLAFGRRKAVR